MRLKHELLNKDHVDFSVAIYTTALAAFTHEEITWKGHFWLFLFVYFLSGACHLNSRYFLQTVDSFANGLRAWFTKDYY